MALLAESLLPPVAPGRGRRVGAPSILGALLLHGGVVLAITLLAQHSLPPPPMEIEVIWPAPVPAPAPAAPMPAAPMLAAESPPPAPPQAIPEPELEPEPLPDALAPESPLREKPEPDKPKLEVKARPKPIVQPAQQPVQIPAPELLLPSDMPVQATAPMPAAPAAVQAAPPIALAAVAAPREAAPPPVSAYNAILLDWLRRHMEYPRAARLRRQQGEVRLKLELDRGGRLLMASLATSSNHATLDEAALAMAQRAAPYPPPLDMLGQQRSAVFIVPLRFELKP
ncbi:energy transducer TonB [Ferrovibrio sp.]|uniref:energy transducer TonB n=1 Tax=Ferrovibrio sp. TaxID=1917215 RepID=UPI003D0B73AC